MAGMLDQKAVCTALVCSGPINTGDGGDSIVGAGDV